MDSTVALTECNKHGLEHNVDQEGDDIEVAIRLIHDVEEAPSVEGGGVGIKDITGCRVKSDGLSCEKDDLVTSPSKNAGHGEEEDDGEYKCSDRVLSRKFPQAQCGHLREADERLIPVSMPYILIYVRDTNHAIHDALENGKIAISKLLELAAPNPVHLDGEFGAPFERSNAERNEKQEDEEKGQSGDEEVCLLDLALVCYTSDTEQCNLRGVITQDVFVVGAP